jgi:TM2 domain-containing membrane protein YozV
MRCPGLDRALVLAFAIPALPMLLFAHAIFGPTAEAIGHVGAGFLQWAVGAALLFLAGFLAGRRVVQSDWVLWSPTSWRLAGAYAAIVAVLLILQFVFSWLEVWSIARTVSFAGSANVPTFWLNWALTHPSIGWGFNPITRFLGHALVLAAQAGILYAGARVGGEKIVRAGLADYRKRGTGRELDQIRTAPAVVAGGGPMDDPLLMTKGMSDSERLMFVTEFSSTKKSATTAVLLALFLGGLGAHHFYLGKIGLGILYVLLVWTLIPQIVALVECFLLKDRVRMFNVDRAHEIILRLKVLRAA